MSATDCLKASIRAYGAQEAFRLESYKRIDKFTRAARSFYNLNRPVECRYVGLLCSHAHLDGSAFVLRSSPAYSRLGSPHTLYTGVAFLPRTLASP